ncbi:MarR family winged helix-turn-helix transcriptional regulator [Staphylococcus massiliensis]|uniref:MarR family winged helix-turn-helix transcriptional regulator n=1 Tax=Staphylococcus massiliensis TaxID=555791 RepID=UPI000304497F|nr:MarR family transcriptional regulator [Staphylococcus massiliensis]MCG3400693.1 winged helix DNA-binding protein [Staphylococcus massiliensis]MCG3402405.1 winged helix DNA-binding protein [Staphylococcus massiliensis]MCG3411631.1 winged helix DNA-binding protein [Staphylococcus massiliensis]POA01473.1 MarR family transcriptional regulator [Staphylococcus massiliensis CCUG 55927]
MSQEQIKNHIDFLGKFINDIHAFETKILQSIRADYQISAEQSHVISLLAYEKPLTLTEITEFQGVNKAAVSRRIKKLINLDMVKWTSDGPLEDKRYKYITLTEKGRSYVEHSKTVISDLAQTMLSDLSIEEVDHVRQVLEIVDDRLNEYVNNYAQHK